jgi:hypothetical protein
MGFTVVCRMVSWTFSPGSWHSAYSMGSFLVQDVAGNAQLAGGGVDLNAVQIITPGRDLFEELLGVVELLGGIDLGLGCGILGVDREAQGQQGAEEDAWKAEGHGGWRDYGVEGGISPFARARERFWTKIDNRRAPRNSFRPHKQTTKEEAPCRRHAQAAGWS